MVHVRMGEDDRVDLGDPVLDAREPHLRRGVDQERGVARDDVGAAAAAAVARVGRRADRAVAADLRHPDARPRP